MPAWTADDTMLAIVLVLVAIAAWRMWPGDDDE